MKPLAAYLLHHYDWSESSAVLDLFTREQGRLTVIAKGAKRPTSQLRAVLLPFQRVHVSLVRPKVRIAVPSHEDTSGVHTLRSAEFAGGLPMFKGAALFSGFYMNELLMKFLPRQDAHEHLFDVYAETLPSLVSSRDENVEAALRAFELKLLQAVGLLPELGVVTLTRQDVRSDARYALLPEAGIASARPGESPISGQVLIGLQAALEHGSVPALQQAARAALPELKTALRGLLHYHLGTPHLRTRQVMLQMPKP